MFILYVCLIVFDVVSQEPNKQNKIKKKKILLIKYVNMYALLDKLQFIS